MNKVYVWMNIENIPQFVWWEKKMYNDEDATQIQQEALNNKVLAWKVFINPNI